MEIKFIACACMRFLIIALIFNGNHMNGNNLHYCVMVVPKCLCQCELSSEVA